MTDKAYYYYWINRTHNPHPREFIGGYHCGAICKHDRKGKLVKLPKTDLLKNYHGKHDPREYHNGLYDNPNLHLLGYHERKYLLKGREYFVPTFYERPYYIDQITIHDTITRSDLTRRNVINAHVLADRLDDKGRYTYRMEKGYQDKMDREELKVAAAQKRNDYVAKKQTLKKEGEIRSANRQAEINSIKPSLDKPVLRENVVTFVKQPPVVYTQTTYETVPVREQIPSVLESNLPTIATSTSTSTTTNTLVTPNVVQEQYITPNVVQEQVLVPTVEEDLSYSPPKQQSNISYTEVTSVPVKMTSSEFGGQQTSTTTTTTTTSKKGKGKGRKGKGKSFTNDPELAKDKNVEYIEETTRTTTLNE